MQVWVGQIIDPSNPSNYEKFVKDGKPVNPSIAASAFGPQTLLFSGDSFTFPINQGTGGTFILSGSLTNATTSPSD